MSDTETGRTLRVLEVAPGHWIGKCAACSPRGYGTPGSQGKFQGETHADVDHWWKRHKETESHKRGITPDAFEKRHANPFEL